MRKKKPGARSMDFEISPDDRIGGSPKRRGRAPAPKSRKPAKPAVADGRMLVLLYFADCDPAGHQMILSVTRKLQAFQRFPEGSIVVDNMYPPGHGLS